nr:MAG TPA: hypothetical protein [Caudoviricetes sp.]
MELLPFLLIRTNFLFSLITYSEPSKTGAFVF